MIIVSGIVWALFVGPFVYFVLPALSGWRRAVVVFGFAVLMGGIFYASVDFAGKSKEAALEWRDLDDTEVLGSSMIDNDWIYVLLAMPETHEPRLYHFPWSQALAEQLQQAEREGNANGTGVRMRAGDKGNPGLDDRESMFYAPPQPSLPDKNYRDTPVLETD